MLANYSSELFNPIMQELNEEFDPNSLEELVYLLPDRCQDCPFAKFILALARVDVVYTGQPLGIVKCIEESCMGYEGPDIDSEYYSDGFDRSGRPYVVIRSENAPT